jgi:hypothetical protein
MLVGGSREIRASLQIAAIALVALLLVPASAAVAGPKLPSPSRAKSIEEMELGLSEVFGHTFQASEHSIDCNKRIGRTIVRCDVYFHFHQRTWSGHGRIWRDACNGTGGTTENTHHVCWFDNWRLKRFDEACYSSGQHSVGYCTKLIVRH